jgi:hypothetical protein
MYERGEGTAKDINEALAWYSKAAEAGESEAQHCLGRIYYMGEGTPRNPAEGVKWLLSKTTQPRNTFLDSFAPPAKERCMRCGDRMPAIVHSTADGNAARKWLKGVATGRMPVKRPVCL